MQNTFLTKEGHDKLQQELDFLRKDRRQEVAARLREASDIKELEILLATAKIIKEGSSGGQIQVGSKVTIREEGYDKKESFIIVGAAEAYPNEGKISNESPLGHALLGHEKNDMVTVEAPEGAYSVKILKVS